MLPSFIPTVERQFTPGINDGDNQGINSIRVKDNVGTYTKNLKLGQNWTIEVDFMVSGPSVPVLGGDWTLTAIVESIGSGNEKIVSTLTPIPVGSAPLVANSRTYLNNLMTVAAGEVSEGGSYRLSIMLTHTNLGVQTENVCFAHGPVLHFA